MNKMFCFQCEQTAGGKACVGNAGVCGKKADTSNLQDKLIGELISLANAVDGYETDEITDNIVTEGLFMTITNVNFDNDFIEKQIAKTKIIKNRYMPGCAGCSSSCGKNESFEMSLIWDDNEDIRSLKSLILFALKGIAAYAHHAMVLGYKDEEVTEYFYEALRVIGGDLSADELLEAVFKTGEINLKCMELLDKANTETYGAPVPTQVPTTIEAGPFIVISGHDLRDLYLLLEQTKGKGINIYTHGEMLPAHAYPKLKEYSHLKGNFGTAWQNQQKEFENIPGPVLFTTNCIMPVKSSYADRIFTTEVVAYPEMVHIDDDKDFTPVINKALELGGFKQDELLTGINGGNMLTTGFARNAVLSVADKIVDAVKSGDIKHIFLVGGCDGAKPGRNYYTEFVQKAPKDTIILTLACGKYRFNDLDIGEIGGIPRILDMGQCNDAYSAIEVAATLAKVFDCGLNDLPLTLVLSWYEQKAVCILLTLLHLGMKNIYLGPTLPAFASQNIVNTLVEKFQLTPISTPEEDLKKILG